MVPRVSSRVTGFPNSSCSGKTRPNAAKSTKIHQYQTFVAGDRKPLKIPHNVENGSLILYPSPLISALIRGKLHAYDYQATNQMVGTRDFGIFTRRKSPRSAALAPWERGILEIQALPVHLCLLRQERSHLGAGDDFPLLPTGIQVA